MKMHVSGKEWNAAEADWLIVPIPEGVEWAKDLKGLDESLNGLVSRLKERGDLTGKLGEIAKVLDVPNIAAKRLLCLGLGTPDKLNVARFNQAFMTAARAMSDKPDRSVSVLLPDVSNGSLNEQKMLEIAARAFTVGSMGQGLYQKEAGRHEFASAEFLRAETPENQAAVDRGEVIGNGINLVRELVNLSPDDMYPKRFAKRASKLAKELELDCEVFDEDRLKSERMGSMLAVAKGSARPPQMVVLKYQGASADAPTLALVGKGVTFDSGGLSLKPTESMLTMKCDMAGAATVLGTIVTLARLKAPVNVTGYMGLVENMVSGKSYKLGDVLTARNGVTIEVLNTDAEGRLVLADVLSYAVEQKPARMIDLATLTGSCVIALGELVTGAFTNNQSWCDELLKGAERAGEDVWQLPMFDHYAELLQSDVADCKNIGGRWGGAITAAKFLEKFVGDVPWVHLDIAGPSFFSSNKPHQEGGGTCCMVRTLIELAESFSAT
jgi:leucyl aminopeptidase